MLKNRYEKSDNIYMLLRLLKEIGAQNIRFDELPRACPHFSLSQIQEQAM